MAFFYNKCACHQFMMHYLIHALFRIFLIFKNYAGASIAKPRVFIIFLIIEFIKSHPVFDFIFVTFHHCEGIFYKKID